MGATVAEYVDVEERNERKFEFRAGRVAPAPDGSYLHSRVTVNVGSCLLGGLKASPQHAVLASNMRIGIAATAWYVYPDVTVVRGEPEFDPDLPPHSTLCNPCLIVEVVSPETEADDRGARFIAYRTLPSLQEYVLVLRDRPQVETFVRQADGKWMLTVTAGADASAALASVGVDLPLSEVYAGVTFPDRVATGVAHPR